MDENALSISIDENQEPGELPAYYTLQIKKFSLLRNEVNRYESAVFKAEGCKWKLVIYPKGNRSKEVKRYVSVYLALTDNLEGYELVYADFKFYLLDQKNHNDFILPDYQDEGKARCFHKLKPEWGSDQFIRTDKFEDPGNGYIVDDTCVFGVEIVSVRKERVTGRRESFSIAKETPPFKYTWRIEKFSKIKKEIRSKIFTVGEQEWKIELYPKGTGHGEKDHLSLYLCLADDMATKGRIYAEVTLRILDQAKDRHIVAKGNFWFDESSTTHGWSRFTPHYHLNRSRKFLLAGDVCIVEAEVKVLGLAHTH